MKILLTFLLLVTFITPGSGQDSKKIFAENIRSSEKIIKGAPFSGEAVSESVQILADGNRIVRRSTSRMYRDSEGRFRREDMPKQIGIPGAVVEMPESILILDPVTGNKYVLNSKNKTVRQSPFKHAFDFNFDLKKKIEFQMKMETKREEMAEKQAERAAKRVEREAIRAKRAEIGVERANTQIAGDRKAEIAKHAKIAKQTAKVIKAESNKVIAAKKAELEKQVKRDAKTESLGVQNVEGVEAEGTRTTTTIPAGAIGNERAIDIVYEKWYSKDLQLIVSSKHTDPRFGEQTYRLTNIRRDDPQMSLFSPPADYTIVEDKHPRPKPFPMPKVPSVGAKPSAAPVPVVQGAQAIPAEPRKP